MFNFIKQLLDNSKKWALVKTFKVSHNVYTYVYHIHLFEAEDGSRKAEFTCNGEPYEINRQDGWLKKQDIYQEKIYRWLKGRYDPEIPRYSDVPLEDTVVALKGKV